MLAKEDNTASAEQSTESEWLWLDDVLGKLAELGLTARAYDAEGTLVRIGGCAGPFSRLLWPYVEGFCRPQSHLPSAAGPAAPRASCIPGCCCIQVPIQRRRRRIGWIIASFIGRQPPDSEQLSRFCHAHRLDQALLTRAAQNEARFDADQADSLQRLVQVLVEQALEHHVAVRELSELSADLTNTYEELNLVYKIAAGITVTDKPEDCLRNTGAELMEVMNLESLAMRYFRPDQPLISEHISLGADLTSAAAEQAMWDELLGRFESRPEPIVDNQPASSTGQLRSLAQHDRVHRLAAVPMIRKGQLVGAIVALNKGSDFDSTDIKLMKSVADAEAVFLENAYLYEDLQQLLMGMLRALTSSIDAKDQYTCGHSERVALIARRIAEAAGLDEFTTGRVYLAGLLHDIGKIGVPEAVLTKPGRLTKPEFAIMRKHPEVGARILSGIKQVQDLVAGVLFHHERIDGRGYPQGLSGNGIPLFGRIVGLADCFDAMTSNRTYRRALPLEVTLTEIRRFAGTQFDPKLVEAFLKLDSAELLRTARSKDPMDPLSITSAQAGPMLIGDASPGANAAG
jgi:putative nucleotidyltransferase with HDIG domain